MQKYREMAEKSQHAVLARFGKGPKPSSGMTDKGYAKVKAAPESSNAELKGVAPTAGKAPKNRMDRLARGGAVKLASGGRAKHSGHTKVNIMIAPQGGQAPQKVPVPVPVPAGGAPMQARPPMPPPAMAGPGMPPGAMPSAPGGPPPMGMVRKTGGRMHRKEGGRLDGATAGPTMQEMREKQSKRGDQILGHRKHGGKIRKLDAGGPVEQLLAAPPGTYVNVAGQNIKRPQQLDNEKAQQIINNLKTAPGQRNGGRLARGGRTPHMEAGAMTGEGRLEKTEHARKDRHRAPAVAS